MTKSPDQRTIGLAVFAVGALAVLAAGVLAFGKFSGRGPGAAVFASPAPIDVGPQRPPQKDSAHEPLIQSLQGLWIAELSGGRASFQVSGDKYLILFIPFSGPKKGWRLYARGALEVAEGKYLVLALDNDLTPPGKDDPQAKLYYSPLTGRSFAIVATVGADGTLIWEKGPATFGGVHGESLFHPLFEHAPNLNSNFAWKRAEPPPVPTPTAETPNARTR